MDRTARWTASAARASHTPTTATATTRFAGLEPPERFVELCEKAPGSVQERSEGTAAHLAATTEELSEESDERGQGACFHLDLVGVAAAGL